MLRGLAERLHEELCSLAPVSMVVDIIVPEDGIISAWKGGSLVASQSKLPIWWTKEEYERFGPGVVRRKPVSTLAEAGLYGHEA